MFLSRESVGLEKQASDPARGFRFRSPDVQANRLFQMDSINAPPHGRRQQRSPSKVELLGEGNVALGVGIVKIIQQSTALADHFEQASAGAVVLVIILQMFGKLVDPLGQQGDLNVCGTCIPLVESEIFDGCRFGLHTLLRCRFGVGKTQTVRFRGGSVKHFPDSGATSQCRIKGLTLKTIGPTVATNKWNSAGSPAR